jgi:hypothetical protein
VNIERTMMWLALALLVLGLAARAMR